MADSRQFNFEEGNKLIFEETCSEDCSSDEEESVEISDAANCLVELELDRNSDKSLCKSDDDESNNDD